MSRYGRSGGDDGSTLSGVITVLAVIAAFLFGYYVRDSGYILNIDQTQPQQGVKAK
jgi:hypothetical protein